MKRYYSDPNVQSMLENIIKNPIETPRGYKNADNGIALRGPLSQFFRHQLSGAATSGWHQRLTELV